MKDREPLRKVLLISGLLLLGILGGSNPVSAQFPEQLHFSAPSISKWSDIRFNIRDQIWQVDDSSVDVLVQGYDSQLWKADLSVPSGTKNRVQCTSGTVFPATGGSYFEANCTTDNTKD